jgi:integrase
MPRTPKPWKRAGRVGWWTTLDGRQVLLTEDGTYDEAQQKLFRLLLRENRLHRPDTLDLAIADLIEVYLDHLQATVAPGSYETARARLQVVADHCGTVAASALRASHMERLLAKRAVSNSTKRGYVVALRSCLAYCRREGLVAKDLDPLKEYKLPPAERRERTLTHAERVAIESAATPELRTLLQALGETGARPHILLELSAQDIRWSEGIAVVQSKQRPYTVVLTRKLLEVLQRLAAIHPDGPLLRNTRGLPWTRNAVRCQLHRLGEKLGLSHISAYVWRHSYATDALEAGINPGALAALMGHKDLSMISKHYSHLAERTSKLREAAEGAAEASRSGLVEQDESCESSE